MLFRPLHGALRVIRSVVTLRQRETGRPLVCFGNGRRPVVTGTLLLAETVHTEMASSDSSENRLQLSRGTAFLLLLSKGILRIHSELIKQRRTSGLTRGMRFIAHF